MSFINIVDFINNNVYNVRISENLQKKFIKYNYFLNQEHLKIYEKKNTMNISKD